MKKECVAMLLAGGQGSRLYVLTGNMAKPAVPFGGKFRIIDFPLSNCTNSGIDTVGVLTQYRPYLLHNYIGTGGAWNLDDREGGVVDDAGSVVRAGLLEDVRAQEAADDVIAEWGVVLVGHGFLLGYEMARSCRESLGDVRNFHLYQALC